MPTLFFILTLCPLIIGDADSSVTKRLNDVMPYGPNLLIEKIECHNHILRNYGQKLIGITKTTEYSLFYTKMYY